MLIQCSDIPAFSKYVRHSVIFLKRQVHTDLCGLIILKLGGRKIL